MNSETEFRENQPRLNLVVSTFQGLSRCSIETGFKEI